MSTHTFNAGDKARVITTPFYMGLGERATARGDVGDVVTISFGPDRDGDYYTEESGYIAAECLAPPAAARIPYITGPIVSAKLTTERTVTETVDAEVEVRYFKDGEDVTDRVEAAVVGPAPAYAGPVEATLSYVGHKVTVVKSSRGGHVAHLTGVGRGGDAVYGHLKAEDALALGTTLIALAKEAQK